MSPRPPLQWDNQNGAQFQGMNLDDPRLAELHRQLGILPGGDPAPNSGWMPTQDLARRGNNQTAQALTQGATRGFFGGPPSDDQATANELNRQAASARAGSTAPPQQAQAPNPLLTALQGQGARNAMGGGNPLGMGLQDMSDWLSRQNPNHAPLFMNPGSVTPFDPANPEQAQVALQGRQLAMHERNNSLQQWLAALQTTGNLRNQTGDLGLRQLQALGVGGTPGSLGIAANVEQRATELHGSSMDRERQADAAVVQYIQQQTQAGFPPTADDIARFRTSVLGGLSPNSPLGSSNFRPPQLPGQTPVVQPPGGAQLPGGQSSGGQRPPGAQQPGGAGSIPGQQRSLDDIFAGVRRPYGNQPIPPGDATNAAITNYVTDALAQGHPADQIMSHMANSNRFGGQASQQWWETRFGPFSGSNPHAEARNRLMDAVNRQRPGTVGPQSVLGINPGIIAAPAQWIGSGWNALFGGGNAQPPAQGPARTFGPGPDRR